MHPPPPSSIHLHPAPPNSFQPSPSSLQHPQHYKNQNIAHNWGNFPKFRLKNSKLSVLPENWYTWYIGAADSKSGLRILKLQPKLHFWANFYLKIGTQSVLRKLILILTLVF